MALTVLNNISTLTAQNALSSTQSALQKTLTQLSTGLKINSGSDDSAGLSIANGMQANIAALTQSQQNANNGVGFLQTADGALAQVNTLLNRAVTLATEGASGNITGTQATALNTEFQSILTEVNQIGQTTNFNGSNVFTSNTGTAFDITAGTALNKITIASTLATGSVTTVTDVTTGSTSSFTATSGSNSIGALDTQLQKAVTLGGLNLTATQTFTIGTVTAGSAASAGADTNNLGFIGNASDTYTITTTDTTSLASLNAYAGNTNNNTVFISDSSTVNAAANTQITTSVNAVSATQLGLATNVSGVTTNANLSSTAGAQSALTAINAAIVSVAAQRGTIGASVNRLQASVNVMSNQVLNLQSAVNSIQNADIGKTVANETQYNVLQATGISALQQSNQAQQAVEKLLQ